MKENNDKKRRQHLTRGDMESIKKTMKKIHKEESKKVKQDKENTPFIEVYK